MCVLVRLCVSGRKRVIWELEGRKKLAYSSSEPAEVLLLPPPLFVLSAAGRIHRYRCTSFLRPDRALYFTPGRRKKHQNILQWVFSISDGNYWTSFPFGFVKCILISFVSCFSWDVDRSKSVIYKQIKHSQLVACVYIYSSNRPSAQAFYLLLYRLLLLYHLAGLSILNSKLVMSCELKRRRLTKLVIILTRLFCFHNISGGSTTQDGYAACKYILADSKYFIKGLSRPDNPLTCWI